MQNFQDKIKKLVLNAQVLANSNLLISVVLGCLGLPRFINEL